MMQPMCGMTGILQEATTGVIILVLMLNGDGIGDTPYAIPDGINTDRYPLMAPYHERRYHSTNGYDCLTGKRIVSPELPIVLLAVSTTNNPHW